MFSSLCISNAFLNGEFLEKEKGNKASPPDTSCKQIMEHILLIIPKYIKVGLYYNSDLFKQGKYPLENKVT